MKDCTLCEHIKFGPFGKYGQEYYCDVNDHDITLNVLYSKRYICPLNDKENKDE